MKLFLFFLLIASNFCFSQIFTQSPLNGSVTITPKGLAGSTNSTVNTSNLALGEGALSAISVDAQAVAIGTQALYSNTTGLQNTAVGFIALRTTTTGAYNTALGNATLYLNKDGNSNTALGFNTMFSNTSGHSNTATGVQALTSNTTGIGNTAHGYIAGTSNITGSYNTFVGYIADVTAGNFSNSTAIGSYASINASNKVRIGDANVTVIEGAVAWSHPSDKRLKENILYTSRLGLNFINRLQTVSYNYIAEKAKTRYDGFIAQDVEAVMKELNVDFSGLKKADDGTYSLAYSDFVMPLVNAVKEQQKEIEELKRQVQALIKAQNNKQ